MSAKLTPGEWSISELPILDRDGETRLAKISIIAPRQDGQYSIFSVGKADFSLDHPGFIPCDLEEAEANARLFAASKKMLEALQEILLDMEIAQKNMRDAAKKDPRWDGCAEAIQPRVDAARAAIAAATGEQQ